MSNKRYTDEFKIQAVKQVTERGHTIIDVAKRLDITYKSLYAGFVIPPMSISLQSTIPFQL